MSLPVFLQDKRFLKELDSLHIKEQFVKITVLNWKEQPLEEVQGVAISGSVNLDGNSSMRRTATLSIFAEEKENNLANVDHLFSVNKKCKLELGIVNTVPNYFIEYEEEGTGNKKIQVINYQERYGQIVWFPLGIYVMFNPAIAHSMTGVTISMNLKDKMCLLNGDLGGEIHSSIEFTNQDQLVDADSLSLQKNPTLVYNIIKQLVNHWGNEPLSKIIISQVPLQIKGVVKWTGKDIVWIKMKYNNITLETSQPTQEQDKYIPIQPGYDVGYQYTDFTYPGELACNAGETVTSVLDKIIQVIGNYEYYYDVEGNFIFHQKQNYLNMTNTAYWAKKTNENKKVGNLPSDVYEADFYRLSKPVYNFINNEYTSAYNNTLNYNNLKNDFVVWGAYTAADGKTKQPCRFHLAIDKKPIEPYEQHKIALYKDSLQNIRAVGVQDVEEGYVDQEGNTQYTRPYVGQALFPQATTEQTKGRVFSILSDRTAIDWREEIYYQMCESEKLGTDQNTEQNNPYFQYYAELKENFPKIFDLEKQEWIEDMEIHPDRIHYFLDFIDEDSALGQYSVNNIGRRAKIISDPDHTNCVFEPVIPDIVYLKAGESNEQLINQLNAYGQAWTQVDPSIASLFERRERGGYLNSCYEEIKNLLYQYTHLNNTISITTLPIYYLEPNTRITVEDKPAGIFGDYIIQSMSLPLDISSMMTINAYKALQKI